MDAPDNYHLTILIYASYITMVAAVQYVWFNISYVHSVAAC